MATIQTFRDGSIGLLWRDVRREVGHSEVTEDDLLDALTTGNAPAWAFDAHREYDEDGVRLYCRDVSP